MIINVISVLFLLCFPVCLFIDALWSSAGKGMTSWLSFVMSNCEVVTLPIGIMGRMWCLVVSIRELCPFFTLLGSCNSRVCFSFESKLVIVVVRSLLLPLFMGVLYLVLVLLCST